MKKILCVLPKVTGGGAEKFLISFLNNVDTSRYEMYLVLARRGPFDHEISKGVHVHILIEHSMSAKLLAPTGPFRYVLSLKQSIKEINPDAIISFGSLLNGSVSLSAKLLGFSNRVLLIEAIHESSEIRQHSLLERLFRTSFLKLTYPLASTVVAISEDVASDLTENFGISKNLKTIYYGLDVEKVRLLSNESVEHRWFQRPKSFSTIVTCGRLVEQKGFSILINAMTKVFQNIKLVIVGDGEQRDMLDEKISDLHLQKRIEIIGYDRNPYRYISKADLFVMPSLWEGFGLVLLEAIALGVPVIASDCPSGPRTILMDGECGVLVPPGDSDSLAQAINDLVKDSEVSTRLSLNAYKRAEDFSIKKTVNNYLDLVEDIA